MCAAESFEGFGNRKVDFVNVGVERVGPGLDLVGVLGGGEDGGVYPSLDGLVGKGPDPDRCGPALGGEVG